MNLTVLNVVRAAHVQPRLSCMWVATGNPRQPLACVWIDREEQHEEAAASGDVAAGAEGHIVRLTA